MGKRIMLKKKKKAHQRKLLSVVDKLWEWRNLLWGPLCFQAAGGRVNDLVILEPPGSSCILHPVNCIHFP